MDGAAAGLSLDQVSASAATAGDVDLGGHRLRGVQDPAAPQDAANRRWVEAAVGALRLNGVAPGGDVSLSAGGTPFRITGMADGADPADAATKAQLDARLARFDDYAPAAETSIRVTARDGRFVFDGHRLGPAEPLVLAARHTYLFDLAAVPSHPLAFTSTAGTATTSGTTLTLQTGGAGTVTSFRCTAHPGTMDGVVRVEAPELMASSEARRRAAAAAAALSLDRISQNTPTGGAVDIGGSTVANVADPVAGTDAANRRYLDAAAAAKSLSDLGTAAADDIDFGGQQITGLPAPGAEDHAATKGHLDALGLDTLPAPQTAPFFNGQRLADAADPAAAQDAATEGWIDGQLGTVQVTGGVSHGDISMQGTHALTGLPAPGGADHAARKQYVDDRVAGMSTLQLAAGTAEQHSTDAARTLPASEVRRFGVDYTAANSGRPVVTSDDLNGVLADPNHARQHDPPSASAFLGLVSVLVPTGSLPAKAVPLDDLVASFVDVTRGAGSFGTASAEYWVNLDGAASKIYDVRNSGAAHYGLHPAGTVPTFATPALAGAQKIYLGMADSAVQGWHPMLEDGTTASVPSSSSVPVHEMLIGHLNLSHIYILDPKYTAPARRRLAVIAAGVSASPRFLIDLAPADGTSAAQPFRTQQDLPAATSGDYAGTSWVLTATGAAAGTGGHFSTVPDVGDEAGRMQIRHPGAERGKGTGGTARPDIIVDRGQDPTPAGLPYGATADGQSSRTTIEFTGDDGTTAATYTYDASYTNWGERYAS